MSVERLAIAIRKAGMTSQIRNTAGTYAMRFLEFCYKQKSSGAVLAQKFWEGGIAPSASSSPSPFSPFSETEKNTNFI